MADLEEIVVTIDAKIDGLIKGMNKAEKQTQESTDSMAADLKKLTTEFRGTANAAGRWAAATVAASAAAAAAIVATTTEQVTGLDRAAQRLGENVEVLSAYAIAAKEAGLDQDQFTDALQQTNIQIADFVQTGGGGAFDLITQLGLDARALNELKPSEQLLALGAAIKNVPESAALKFLDDIGSDNLAALLPLLKDGGDLFRAMAQEAIDTGRAIRREDVEAIRLMDIELKKAQADTAALGTQFSAALSPFIIVAVQHFKDLTEEGIVFTDVIEEGFKVAAKAVGIFADGVQAIEILFKAGEAASGEFVATLSEELASTEESILGFIPIVALAREALEAFGDTEPLEGFSEAARKQAEGTKKELEDLLAEPLASDVAKTFSERILSQVAELREKLREEAAAEDPVIIPVVPEIEAGLDTLDPENVRFFSEERLKEAVIQLRELNKEFEDSQQTQLAVLRERFEQESSILQEARDRGKLTEEKFIDDKLALEERFNEQRRILSDSEHDRLLESQERDLEELQGFLDEKLISEEEFEERKNEVNRRFAEESIDLARREAVAKSFFGKKTTTDIIDGINSLGQVNEKAAKVAFRVNQAKAVSDTIVSTASGIQRAFADLPFPAALAASVAIAASGIAQLATITSQSFGSGGGAPASSVGAGLGGAATAGGATVTPADETALDVTGGILGAGGVPGGGRIELTLRIDTEGADDVAMALGSALERLQSDAKISIPAPEGTPS